MRIGHVLLGLAGLTLLGAAAGAGLHAGELRRAWILRFQMHEAAPGVMVNDSVPAERVREFVDLAAAGRARAAAWFGPLQSAAMLVVVHDNALRLDLGVPRPFAWNPEEEGNRRVYVGPQGLSVDVMAHGIAHAEIKERTGLARWGALPAWFDEGLASQVDERPFLSDPLPAGAAPAPAEQLRALRSHAAFTGEQGEDNLVTGKREVTRWLRRTGGAPAADRLLAAVRAGEEFDLVYARLEAGAGP